MVAISPLFLCPRHPTLDYTGLKATTLTGQRSVVMFPLMYKLICRRKLIDTFDLFSEAWVYARLYMTHVSHIIDVKSDDYHLVIPVL